MKFFKTDNESMRARKNVDLLKPIEVEEMVAAYFMPDVNPRTLVANAQARRVYIITCQREDDTIIRLKAKERIAMSVPRDKEIWIKHRKNSFVKWWPYEKD